MIIEKLEWDSNFIEKRIGKVNVLNNEHFDPDLFLIEAESLYDLIYVFSYEKPLMQDVVHRAKLNLVEIMLTMSKSFGNSISSNIKYDFRQSLNEKELSECYEIAEHTSEVSRFNYEPLVGKRKTRDMYRKWIDNALNNTFSDGIFIQKINDKIVGIHLIRTDSEKQYGYFTLTGVHKQYIGKGIGKRLWEDSYCYWNNNHYIKKIISPFSLQNIGSFNFHLKMGFNRIEEAKYIYHFRNAAEDDSI